MSKIAFSNIFPDVRPLPPLRAKLDGAMLVGAAIDRAERTIELQMETRAELGGDEIRALGQEICTAYGFADARIACACCPIEPAREKTQGATQAGSDGGRGAEKKRDGAVGEVFYGEKKPVGKTEPVGTLDLKTGKAAVISKIFAFE
ncbi:hypothetical protein, partial [Oscillibacter sp.]|uniref:hypothetical protein n=1 Tax=Oscillibacter sp. TaxID=1945593 RepID=UPI00289D767F